MGVVGGVNLMKLLLLVIGTVSMLGACSDELESCGVQGATQICQCPSGAEGAQTCSPDGIWGTCACTGSGGSLLFPDDAPVQLGTGDDSGVDDGEQCTAGDLCQCPGGACPGCPGGGCDFLCPLASSECVGNCPGGNCSQTCPPSTDCTLQCPNETLLCPLCTLPIGCTYECGGLRPVMAFCFGGN